jgi:hypothetical protein
MFSGERGGSPRSLLVMLGSQGAKPDPMDDVRSAKAALIEFGVEADIEMMARLESLKESLKQTVVGGAKIAGPMAALSAGLLGFFSMMGRIKSAADTFRAPKKRKGLSIMGAIGMLRIVWPIVSPFVSKLMSGRRGRN